LGTRNGKSIRFSEEQIRPSGRKTMGVKGITLSSDDDRLVGMLLIKREGTTVLVATEKGFGKRTEISQYRAQKRGGKGVLTMKTTEKVGKMVTIKEVVDKDDLMIITNQGVLNKAAGCSNKSYRKSNTRGKAYKVRRGNAGFIYH
jgi:DNA gyrase subunit A